MMWLFSKSNLLVVKSVFVHVFTVLALSGEIAVDQSVAEVEEVDERGEDDEEEGQNKEDDCHKYLKKTKVAVAAHLEMTPRVADAGQAAS